MVEKVTFLLAESCLDFDDEDLLLPDVFPTLLESVAGLNIKQNIKI